MDVWDDDFREPTEDERTARRVVALAIALTNARRPVTTSHIRIDFYPELGDEAFRKAYQRDRARLGATGLSVVRHDLPTGEAAWQIDKDASFVGGSDLTPEDALYLDCLLLPLAADPTLPFAHDLRLALTKIDRSFSGDSVAPIPPEARVRNRQLERLETCLSHRHAARVSYERSDGSRTDRTIVPLGLFHLRSTTYLVASRLLDQTDGKHLQEPHVYNLDRFHSVREIANKTYPMPPDFSVRDYIRLPFQLGPTIYEAEFCVPAGRLTDVRKSVANRGIWRDENGTMFVRLAVADEEAAGAWAIAEGLRPTMPESLVSEWNRRLQTSAEEGVR